MYLQADAVTNSRPSDARDETQRGLRIVERTETRQKRALDKVMDTEPSTTHGCDIFSELQAVGLAGSVSIAQPIIETTVVSARDHARLLVEVNRKLNCIWDITYCRVSSSRQVRPSSSGQPIRDTWTHVSEQHEGRLHTRDRRRELTNAVFFRQFGKSSRPWLHGKPCHEKIAALVV